MDQLSSIENPYLLVSGLKCVVDKQSHHYVDRLWYKDLIEHCRYLKNFTLAAPCEYCEPSRDLVRLDDDSLCSAIQFVDLPNPSSFLKSIFMLPKTCYYLWKAIGRSEIVHSGLANWPIPYGWLVTPLARMRGKPHVIVVESAFWRLPPGISCNWKKKLRSLVTERLNRWCVNRVDLSIFTEQAYLKSLLTNPRGDAAVIQASWIDEQDILFEQEAIRLWDLKDNSTDLRILFAGRLTESKGIKILLEALNSLRDKQLPLIVDLLGEGELFAECEQSDLVRMLGTLPYGQKFFNALQNYHAVIIPSLTDEQPRIVYDAFSQAIPVLGTKTSGLMECVSEGITGWLTEPNDPLALADLLSRAVHDRRRLHAMGLQALKQAHYMTHQKMHQERLPLLLKL